MRMLLAPSPLKPGDRVALTAPSSPVSSATLKKAVNSIRMLDLEPVIMKSCRQSRGYLAGTDIQRAEDLNSAFSDKDIKGIFCLRGGYGAMRLLPLLNFKTIEKNPKPFIGSSDITALHSAINRLCGFITFHAPMPASDYTVMDSFTINSLKNLLFSPSYPAKLNNPPGERLMLLNPTEAKHSKLCKIAGSHIVIRGVSAGGNLSVLAAALGSPYEIDAKGKLLFLEDVGEEPYRLDRAFTSLSLAGKFRDCSGIILGTFTQCENLNSKVSGPASSHERNLFLTEIIKDIILPYKKPTLFNFRAGHIEPQSTIPMGGEISFHLSEASCVL